MTHFVLDSQLARDSIPVCELNLCDVRLINDSHYPWLILIPRIAGIVEVIDLSTSQQTQLWNESALVCKMLKQIHDPDKLNVAAIGNLVSQCHVHHIARFTHDKTWPAPVWGKHSAKPYPDQAADQIIQQYTDFISTYANNKEHS